jgi:uncharacterized protein YajQ (UPF0234 family)
MKAEKKIELLTAQVGRLKGQIESLRKRLVRRDYTVESLKAKLAERETVKRIAIAIKREKLKPGISKRNAAKLDEVDRKLGLA